MVKFGIHDSNYSKYLGLSVHHNYSTKYKNKFITISVVIFAKINIVEIAVIINDESNCNNNTSSKAGGINCNSKLILEINLKNKIYNFFKIYNNLKVF